MCSDYPNAQTEQVPFLSRHQDAKQIPWILYEAGVAKGKLGTPVQGIALGVPLSRVSAGPFYQFHNLDDTEDSIAKLVLQLCRRVTGLEPDEGVVAVQVQEFKASAAEVLKTIGGQKTEKPESVDEGSVAKVLEEMKLIVRDLPQRFEQQMAEGSERSRSRKFPFRRFDPMMVDEMAHMVSKRSGDPIGILIIASLVRDEFPWLYEIGLDAYHAAKGRNIEGARDAIRTFRDVAEATIHGPFMFEMGFGDKATHMLMRDIPMMIDHYMESILEKPVGKRTRVSSHGTEEHS